MRQKPEKRAINNPADSKGVEELCPFFREITIFVDLYCIPNNVNLTMKIIERRVHMEKAKLGISIGLLGAAAYFSGLISTIVLVLIAGYILLAESNAWLRKCAVKAVVIVMAFALIPVLLSFVSDFLSFINSIIIGFGGYANLDWPFGIDNWINIAAGLIEKILLVALGFTALHQGTIPLGPIDKVVDRHL